MSAFRRGGNDGLWLPQASPPPAPLPVAPANDGDETVFFAKDRCPLSKSWVW